MIELTREDRVRINDAIDPFRTNSGSQMQEMIDAIYRAGMAAMAERAAKAAEGASITINDGGPAALSYMAAIRNCAAAIRNLLKPS